MISIKNEYGEIRISEEAIAEIASCAAMQCYGVVGLAGRTFPKGIPDFLKKSLRKGVLVSQREDDSYDLDLYVVIEYGTKLAEVARNLCEQVRYQVESITGARVGRVDVHVQRLKMDK